jgi:DNA recombination protein RmuC
VIRLAGGRSVVVDAKVTLAAYLEAIECDEDKQAHERMAAHARHLRQHVDRLAEKAYWTALPDNPEFVVLFLPGEAFLAPALEHDPALLEHAYAQRVHVATPTTLISLLRTVAHSWQQEALTENARAVVTAGKELYSRLGILGGHVDKLGRSLGTAVSDFNKTVGSLERTLLPAARTLAELSLSEPPEPPEQVSALSRPLSAPELVVPLAHLEQAAG